MQIKNLLILATHPIQYQTPIWSALDHSGNYKSIVLYLTKQGLSESYDPEFNKVFKWDIDTLTGYDYLFPKNPKNYGGFFKLNLPHEYNRFLKENNIGAVFLQGWNVIACWQITFLAHSLGIPVWVRGDSNDLKIDIGVKGFIKRRLLSFLFSKINYFLYVGIANKRLYKSYQIAEDRLIEAPHAVDNQRFRAQRLELSGHEDSIRNTWNVPHDSFCILFAGKFIPEKNPLIFVQLYKALRLRRPEIKLHLLFAGSGEMGLALRENCRVAFDQDAQEYSNIVFNDDPSLPPASFTGFLNQTMISRAYAAANVLVLPSKYETWGLVVNEALISGLPCIASDQCGCAEDLLADLNNKYVFRMGDVSDLCGSLEYVYDNRPNPEILINHALNFSFEKTVAAVNKAWSLRS
jgi:glycosyltransferase involved in cell wall biosynthesis